MTADYRKDYDKLFAGHPRQRAADRDVVGAEVVASGIVRATDDRVAGAASSSTGRPPTS